MAPNRKLIGFDPETLQALELLSRDSGKDLQDLADEAFTDLLAKHHRPRSFKDAWSRCFKRECPLGHFKCMRELSPDAVYDLARTTMPSRDAAANPRPDP